MWLASERDAHDGRRVARKYGGRYPQRRPMRINHQSSPEATRQLTRFCRLQPNHRLLRSCDRVSTRPFEDPPRHSAGPRWPRYDSNGPSWGGELGMVAACCQAGRAAHPESLAVRSPQRSAPTRESCSRPRSAAAVNLARACCRRWSSAGSPWRVMLPTAAGSWKGTGESLGRAFSFWR